MTRPVKIPAQVGTELPVCRSNLLTYTHRSRWSIGHQRPLAVALCSGLLWPFQANWSPCCFSSAPLSCLQLLRGRPLFLFPCRFPGQGLACGAGCWLPEGVSDPAPTSSSIYAWSLVPVPLAPISDFLLPLDFVDAPQTGVKECLKE